MLGSTIRKLDINQTLIYCLRPSINEEPYKLRCSQYYYAMGENETDLFQDRTPRPFINFDKMNDVNNIIPFVSRCKSDWINHYAESAVNRIEPTTTCKHSWQDDMVKIMIQKIIDNYVRNTSVDDFIKYKDSL